MMQQCQSPRCPHPAVVELVPIFPKVQGTFKMCKIHAFELVRQCERLFIAFNKEAV